MRSPLSHFTRLARRARGPTVLPAENGAAAAAPTAPSITPLAALLTRHILRDGELVVLILRPSLWFIPLTCLRFIAATLILVLAAHVFDNQFPPRARALAIEAGSLLVGARLMLGVVQWTSLLYVLTEMRILRLSGIFQPEVFDCPLRRVARARMIRTIRERPLNLGSIEIIPYDDDSPAGVWQTIARPREVHRIVLATIAKAKQGGPGHFAR